MFLYILPSLTLLSQLNGKLSTTNSSLNVESKNLTSSSYYPTSVIYRSVRSVHLKCTGYIKKAISAGVELAITPENGIPEKCRPSGSLVIYAPFDSSGEIMRIAIQANGKITFTSPKALTVNASLNLHVNYVSG